ncbi:Hypothetical protein SCLAV_3836 [Streptomyces clavuligerus]|uniref:Uncharacterized protein n=1 Tax=Streptomyces clavuligerus TaxID=1901 RepID=B5GSW4_STRCL|nr:hypothetical protein SSCG_02438 [Streptomyces clavuligerus]EFG08908.1 Hypothetical protein SCLAV_3836 [Streptomyces clavuligerus]
MSVRQGGTGGYGAGAPDRSAPYPGPGDAPSVGHPMNLGRRPDVS